LSKSPRSSRLFGLLRRRTDRVADVEPADLGTAFGMELSLMPDDDPASAAPAAAPAKPARGHWWQRARRLRQV
jgi:hypothetical protein